MRRRFAGMGRRVWAVAVAALAIVSARAADRCAVCNAVFGTKVFTLKDRWTQEARMICESCSVATNWCSVCNLPVTASAVAVGDGRFLCPRDAALVVLDDGEVLKMLAEARRELDRLFSRFTTFPSTNVNFAFEDQVHMQMLLDTPSFDRQCPSLVGYTQSRRQETGRWQHKIRLLRGRPRAEMVGVYVHELSHAWARENLSANRQMKRDAEEGFCELVASRLLEQLGDRDEVARLFRNNYTRGQIQLFQKAYEAFDFHVVLEWMRHGVDGVLIDAEVDRVRLVHLPASQSPGPVLAPVDPTRVRPSPARDRLTLVGVLGGGGRPRALVNDVALGIGETGVVRVGTNQVGVRCLSVGPNRATLELSETGENLVLELGK